MGPGGKLSRRERRQLGMSDHGVALRRALLAMEAAKDSAYAERNMCVALIARLALTLGFKAGVGQHDPLDQDWEADWRTIVFIDLPTGQVSWHLHDSEKALVAGLPAYDGKWDGHTTPEKYERVAKFGADLDGLRAEHGAGAFVAMKHFASDGTPLHPVSECVPGICWTDEPSPNPE